MLVFLVTLPLWLLVGLMVLVDSGWPIFYKQPRVGKNNKPFVMYKFRTMIVRADKAQRTLARLNEAKGPVFKIHDDPRYTRVGKFLAHVGLDELPQLWNVLRGDMALFGPRPLPVYEVKKLAVWQKARHAIKPGIISPAVLTGRYHEDFNGWMRDDLQYIQKKSILYDTSLVWSAVGFLGRLFAREVGF